MYHIIYQKKKKKKGALFLFHFVNYRSSLQFQKLKNNFSTSVFPFFLNLTLNYFVRNFNINIVSIYG